MNHPHEHNVRSPPAREFRFTLRGLMGYVLVTGVCLGIATWLYQGVQDSRQAAIRMTVEGQFCKLSMALLNYHDHYGSFPPAYIADDDGTPIHNWRALILPFIEEHSLYERYRFDEPWDGPSNSQLHDQMPEFLRARSEEPSNRFTSFVAITGPGTAFPGSGTTSEADITDGEDFIMITEISGDKINWLQPVDIDITAGGLDPQGAGIHISAVKWRRPFVSNGRCRTFPVGKHVTEQELISLATISGGEDIKLDEKLSE